MQTLRRLFAHTRRDATGRWRHVKILALVLVVVLPGGLVLPIFYGIYGAIRHTLTPKTATRSAPEASTAAPASPESDARG